MNNTDLAGYCHYRLGVLFYSFRFHLYHHFEEITGITYKERAGQLSNFLLYILGKRNRGRTPPSFLQGSARGQQIKFTQHVKFGDKTVQRSFILNKRGAGYNGFWTANYVSAPPGKTFAGTGPAKLRLK